VFCLVAVEVILAVHTLADGLVADPPKLVAVLAGLAVFWYRHTVVRPAMLALATLDVFDAVHA